MEPLAAESHDQAVRPATQRAVRLVPRFLGTRLKLLLELGTEALAAKDFAGKKKDGAGVAGHGRGRKRTGTEPMWIDLPLAAAATNPPRRKGIGGWRRSAASGG